MKVKVQNKKQKGMTLIEITLVIAILLSLIAILFLGISAYKKGADRSKCILQAASMEKLIISHGNMYSISPGQATPAGVLWDTNFAYLTQAPTCPADATAYTVTDLMPTGATGSIAFATCASATEAALHLFQPYN